jgi:hypothetical protein
VEAAREHLQKSGIQVKEGSIPPDSSLEAARKCYLKDGPTKLQKALTVMLEEKVEAELVRKQTPEDDVRMASSCAKESARVFSTYPTTATRRMGSSQFNTFVKLRFGIGIDRDVTCKCGTVMKKGTPIDHFTGCKMLAGSALTARHDGIKTLLASFFNRAGARAEIERSLPGEERIRPDITVSTPHSMSHIDVSVVHPLAPSHIAAARMPEPRHIINRENSKCAKYGERAADEEAQFIPAVVDTFGMFGSGMVKVIDLLRSTASSLEAAPGSPLVKELEEALPFQIQRGNVQAVFRGLADAKSKGRLIAERFLANIFNRITEQKVSNAVQHQQNPIGNVQAPDASAMEVEIIDHGNRGHQPSSSRRNGRVTRSQVVATSAASAGRRSRG